MGKLTSGLVVGLLVLSAPLSADTTGRTIIVYPPSGGGNTFSTMDAPSGTDPVADSSSDILQFLASGPLTITGDSGADSLTFTVTPHTVDTGPIPDCTGTDGQLADGSCVDLATQAELDALDTTDDDLSDNQLGDLSDVSEVGAGAGEALVADGLGDWAPSAATVCLSDGTNCPVDNTGTDDQTATEVPYTPSTPADWTDPDPTEVGGALDTLAGRTEGATTEAGLESDLTDVANVYTDNDTHASLTATGIDGDGDGTPAFTCTDGTNCAMDPDDDGVADLTITNGAAISTADTELVLRQTGDFFGATSLTLQNRTGFNGAIFGNAALELVDFIFDTLSDTGRIRYEARTNANRVDETNNNEFQFSVATTVAKFHFVAGDAVTLIRPGGVTKVKVDADATEVANDLVIGATAVLSPSTATCPDDGTAAAGTVTITPSTSNGLLDNNDPDGCGVVFSETGAVGGQIFTLTVTETAGGNITFTDSSGVLELPGGTTINLTSVGDAIHAEYRDLTGTANDAWYVRNSWSY